MSIAVELYGKQGRVCSRDYRNGNGCPLIVRPTSEDVLTANVFGILRRLRPSLWLRSLLSEAFETKRFNTCSMKSLDVAFWQDLPPPPARLREGWSQPDLVIRFADTMILVEAKYRAGFSKRTTHDEHRDQLARLLDVAFAAAVDGQFFRRDPWVLVIGVGEEPELVERYRDERTLREALAHYERFGDAAAIARTMSQRVGYVSWQTLAGILAASALRSREMERGFLEDLVAYIKHKVRTASLSHEKLRQLALPLAPEKSERCA